MNQWAAAQTLGRAVLTILLTGILSMTPGCWTGEEPPPTGPTTRATVSPDTADLGNGDQEWCNEINCEELEPGEWADIWSAISNADWNLNDGDCLLMRNGFLSAMQDGNVYKFSSTTHSGYAGMHANTIFINDLFLIPERVKWVVGHESAHAFANIGLEDPYWSNKRGVPSMHDSTATQKAQVCLT